ncbi:MAG: hypothetical protein AB7T63_12080 [Planctomycetota bacterium]
MTTARLERVLEYVDGVQAGVLIDTVGTRYLAILVERSASADTYLCVRVSAERVADVLSGVVEVLTAVLEPEVLPLHKAVVTNDGTNELRISDIADVPPAWLPGPGPLYGAVPASEEGMESGLIRRALATNRATAVLHLEPREAVASGVVNASTLTEAIKRFATLVRLGCRGIKDRPKAKRDGMASMDALQVVAFSAGSFEVHLQSRDLGDLMENTRASRGLEVVSDLIHSSATPDDLVSLAREIPVDLVTSFQSFLRFVHEASTPVSVAWTGPGGRHVRAERIQPRDAMLAYRALTARTELFEEPLELVGSFYMVDERGGKWRIATADGKDYSGVVDESSGNALLGVTMTPARYVLQVTRRLMEDAGTGREHEQLTLRELRKQTEL